MSQPTYLPIRAIKESPFNYRRTFGNAGLQELAESIKHAGILQPVLVRPLAQADVEATHELVFGHRRFRAALLADLAEVPVFIREMTDEQVKEAQLIENLQREDVHPIEEAEGFVRLMEEFNLSVAQLMEKTGKERTYVYNRLKLRSLTDEVREACLRGEVGSEVATVIARLPAKLQAQAFKASQQSRYDHDTQTTVLEPLPMRAAKQRIADIMEPMADACWDLADGDLTADGPCSTCEKRSINDPGLSSLNRDCCTDPVCFEQKTIRFHANKVDTARSTGVKIIEGKEAENQGGYNATYRDLGASAGQWENGRYVNRSFREALGLMREEGADTPEVVLVVDPKTQLSDEMISHEDARNVEAWLKQRAARIEAEAKALQDSVDASSATQGTTPSSSDSGRSRYIHPSEDPSLSPVQRAMHDPEQWGKIRRAIFDKIMAAERTTDDLRLLVRAAVEDCYQFNEFVVEVMDWEAAEGWPGADDSDDDVSEEEWLIARLPTMAADELTKLLLALAVERMPFLPFEVGHTAKLELAARYEVDVPRLLGIEEPAPAPTPSLTPAWPLSTAVETQTVDAAEAVQSPARQASTTAGRVTPRYRNPETGETWSGRGLQPKWLTAAIVNGKSLRDFDTQVEGASA